MADLNIWAFPVNAILALVFVLATCLCAKSSFPVLRWLKGWRFAVAMIIVALLFMAVEGTWGWKLHSRWEFIIAIMLMMVPLSAIAVREISSLKLSGLFGRSAVGMSSAGCFSHVGLFLILIAGLFGAPDVSDTMLIANRQEPERIVYTHDRKMVSLPFGVQLVDFRIDYYDDGVSPKQYTSILDVDGKRMETSVNHPCSYSGWYIYQADYDWAEGRYSVLKVVRDPWLPIVYAGMALLAIGAILSLKETWHGRWVLPVIGVLTVLFSCLSLARINFGTLMPALRSLWFVPHLIIYMVAYSVLAIASVLGVMVMLGEKKMPARLSGFVARNVALPRKLLATSSSLLIIGMLCGSVWAKAAWGDYWTWDAKECWAAVTWMLTLVGTHVPHAKKQTWVIVFIWLSFLAMQITWYGVNYLPASQNSMHTYNMKK